MSASTGFQRIRLQLVVVLLRASGQPGSRHGVRGQRGREDVPTLAASRSTRPRFNLSSNEDTVDEGPTVISSTQRHRGAGSETARSRPLGQGVRGGPPDASLGLSRRHASVHEQGPSQAAARVLRVNLRRNRRTAGRLTTVELSRTGTSLPPAMGSAVEPQDPHTVPTLQTLRGRSGSPSADSGVWSRRTRGGGFANSDAPPTSDELEPAQRSGRGSDRRRQPRQESWLATTMHVPAATIERASSSTVAMWRRLVARRLVSQQHDWFDHSGSGQRHALLAPGRIGRGSISPRRGESSRSSIARAGPAHPAGPRPSCSGSATFSVMVNSTIGAMTCGRIAVPHTCSIHARSRPPGPGQISRPPSGRPNRRGGPAASTFTA